MLKPRPISRLDGCSLMNGTRCFSIVCLLLGLAVSTIGAAEVWPQFRGPGGQGHATAAALPTQWAEDRNVMWKSPVPGKGWSSPVIAGGKIWLTTAVVSELTEEEEKKRLSKVENPRSLRLAGKVSLRVMSHDLKTGKRWSDLELLKIEEPEPIHSLNSYASPSPILDGDRLYCYFGTYGMFCVDTTANKVVWKNQELKLDHQNGPGSSPVLWKDKLIVHCDGIDVQFIAAIDKKTGKTAWKTPRSGEMNELPPLKKAYCTPLILETAGKTELISPAADWVYAYDPETGKELWRCNYGQLGFSTVPRPVAGHGMVFIATSFMKSRLLAVKTGGKGDVSESHVVWKSDRNIPKMPSMLLVGNELYCVDDSGIATCFDAKTGEQHWRERLGGNFSSSPMLAGGKIYFFNRDGDATVIKPGREYAEIAKNALDAGMMASPAVAGDTMILRTDGYLYRIGEK